MNGAAAAVSSTLPLVVEDVAKHFRGVRALDGVSLEARQGEVLGLIGPNGSGKTTLLNVVSGVLRPSAGRVTILGHRCEGRPAYRIARLGVARTFQQIRLFREMTVAENVAVGAVARGRDIAEVPDVLRHTGLEGTGERLAGTLAYGLQRRVEIARALAGGPRLLLLDEPAAGMNEAESDALLATIRGAVEQGECTIVIVDHDLRLIMRLCDRIHVLAEGRTIGEGTPAEVRANQAVIDAYLGVAGGEGTPVGAGANEGEEP
jgi:ABC-type branched-subunit amino acid transport system ATPase component